MGVTADSAKSTATQAQAVEHAASWYAAGASPFASLPRLQGDERADVVILGAGLTGLSAAIELAERGYSVIVLEAHRAGWGASGRSGGQMIFGYGCDISKIASLLGRDDARRLFDWSVEGVDLIQQRIAAYGIDCDLRMGHAHAAVRPRQVDELNAWQHDLENTYGYTGTEIWDRARLQKQLATERYRALLFDPRSGHLHPLEYTMGLARAALKLGVRIFENSRVVAIEHDDPVVFKTLAGQVTARFGLLGGNAWLADLVPQLEAKIMPVGTYICATERLGAARARELIRNDMAVADINFVLDYFRLSSDQRMLFGGRVSYSRVPPPGLGARMRQRMVQVFPQLGDVKLDYVWGGYVDITMNRAPHWGRLRPNLYFAQGFSGHGIATTGLAARVIAEAIHGQYTRLDVFERIPHHNFPGGKIMRTPALVLAMLWYRMKDYLP
ncbi:MAG: FAD-binding oxidoreductase [Pseudomonadota bacterium]|nr:FAD-binding oxidoreductase [Pseudomonadota bacterium]